MQVLLNPHRGLSNAIALPAAIPFPSTNTAAPLALLQQCPAAEATPLIDCQAVAAACGVANVLVKDERLRMGLGSFKALGGAYVIAGDAARTGKPELRNALAGTTYVTASAGNHGLSVAAGAQVFGARAIVFIAETVPEAFARLLRDRGAQVIRTGADYEASMQAASEAAETNGWHLLSDSSWDGYVEIPRRLMEGYLVLMHEVAGEMQQAPSHIVVQAGVGGLAAAVAAFARDRWGSDPCLIVVEPEFAPALLESVRAGRPVTASGPVSTMGRLDCKEPSLIALKGLARDADVFVTISEAEAGAALGLLSSAGLTTTPSGGAGLAALLASGLHRDALGLDTDAAVLGFVTERTWP